jgi:hypothetical protein
MVLKNVAVATVCTVLLAWSGVAVADEYRADQFLGLDLSTAVLSPKRLGPAAEFAPVAVEAKTDRGSEGAQAGAEYVTHARVHVSRVHGSRVNVAHVRAQQPRAAARARLAHRHGNPLDAQAFDTRIQVWPCRSGGICGWKR